MYPKYPQVHVQLTGEDGSAPAIVARCRRAAERAGLSKPERDEFMQIAFSGDYDDLIATAQKWFTCT